MEASAELFIDARSTLGEGPCWDRQSGCLYWVDILERNVHVHYPATGQSASIAVGSYVGAAVPRASGGLVLALQDGFYTYDFTSGAVTALAIPEQEHPGNRFNDGKCDPKGRFWAGTMSLRDEPGQGALYCLDIDGRVRQVLPGVTCSNGIAWSSDGGTLYYIDTPTRRVAAYPFDMNSGELGVPRTVAVIPADEGYPDGMAIDSDGMLWVAQWDGFCVSRWDPNTGERLLKVKVPAARVTSCVFGGERLDELYITTARCGLSEDELKRQPHAGGIFRFQSDVTGAPSYAYNG